MGQAQANRHSQPAKGAPGGLKLTLLPLARPEYGLKSQQGEEENRERPDPGNHTPLPEG